MSAVSDSYNELCYYTLSHLGSDFIHQHAVDAFTAQHSLPADKPIRLVFALVGLYLHIEKGFTGREVQLTHMKLANNKQSWPELVVPADRGSITAETVMTSQIVDRDTMIHEWCKSAWHAFSANRETIRLLLDRNKITDPSSVQGPLRRNR